jgi:hypothetical protein
VLAFDKSVARIPTGSLARTFIDPAMQKAGQQLSRSTQRSWRGVIIMILMICIGLASALLATVVPADVIPMILVLRHHRAGDFAGGIGRPRA